MGRPEAVLELFEKADCKRNSTQNKNTHLF